MDVLGEKFYFLLNITIVYPDGIPSFWEFLCGRIHRLSVRLQTIEIPKKLRQGNYAGDQDFRETFHHWVHQLWQEKDRQIQLIINENGV